MKKWIVLSLALVCLLSLCGCNQQELSSSSYTVTDVENVEISIADVSSAGAVVTIKDTNTAPHTYGEWYEVEQMVDGKWYAVEPIIENYGYIDIGYWVDENYEVKFDIDWTWLYGELPAGTYRILKQAGGEYIAAAFEIP